MKCLHSRFINLSEQCHNNYDSVEYMAGHSIAIGDWNSAIVTIFDIIDFDISYELRYCLELQLVIITIINYQNNNNNNY